MSKRKEELEHIFPKQIPFLVEQPKAALAPIEPAPAPAPAQHAEINRHDYPLTRGFLAHWFGAKSDAGYADAVNAVRVLGIPDKAVFDYITQDTKNLNKHLKDLINAADAKNGMIQDGFSEEQVRGVLQQALGPRMPDTVINTAFLQNRIAYHGGGCAVST